MALNNFVKSIRNIMRNDAGINGDAQRIEQIAWMLFLKVYDEKEMTGNSTRIIISRLFLKIVDGETGRKITVMGML